MPTQEQLRQTLRDRLDQVVETVNLALRGRDLRKLEPVLTRIGRRGRLPHWYGKLKRDQTLPNLDGKTIGSVVEMILVAVLETTTFSHLKIPPLSINPARGVDLPDLDLGVKSPSTNFCTSEPFFSAYERLYGTEHDALVLLTDYQEGKTKPPLRLQIIKWRYLTKSQIADETLCGIARKHRAWLVKENEAWAKKVFRFLAFVNSSDWRARRLLLLLRDMRDDKALEAGVSLARSVFLRENAIREKKSNDPIPDADLAALEKILKTRPRHLGVIDAADNWVVECLKEIGRAPNDNEWNRLIKSSLDGRIGMSFALQWRYNFGRLFGESRENASTYP
jgi:hypothetical protein